MSRLFWRFFLLVALGLLLFGLAAFWLAKTNIGRADHQLQRWQQSRLDEVTTIVEQLVAKKSPSSLPQALDQLARDYHLPFALTDQAQVVYASPLFYRNGYGGGQGRNHSNHPHDRPLLQTDRWDHGEPRTPSGFPLFKVFVREANQRGATHRNLSSGQTLWLLPPKSWQADAPSWLVQASSKIGPLIGLTMIVILALLYPLIRQLSRRFSALSQTMVAFGAGDLQARAEIRGDDELARLAGQFNQMAGQIEQLVRSHKTLLATTSHELRSPLARLRMASSLLAESDNAGSSPTWLAEINQNIQEMDALIEEIMLTAKLDGQHDAPLISKIDLPQLIAELADAFPDVKVTWHRAVAAIVGNAKLLKRALRNLIENAQRYGNGTVMMDIHAVDQDRVEIAVSDTGAGIPAEYVEQVFEPFFRLPSHAEHAGGVGLGLYIVQQIATLHEGVRYVSPGSSSSGNYAGRSTFIIAAQRA